MRVIIGLVTLAICFSVGGCSRPYQEAYAKALPSPPRHPTNVKSVKRPPLPARKFPELTKARSEKSPPLSPRKSTQARSPASASPGAPVLPPTTAKHYVVLDTVGNCAVVDAKPGAGLEIIGDKGGYASLESANKALRDAKAKCKGVVGTGADAKFKAAQAKAKKLGGVHKLTSKDIEGLSTEQIKQLRGY
jgi:hypothetical protein